MCIRDRLCAAAIGATADVLERASALVDAQVDALVLDSAHGHSQNILNAVSRVKAAFPNVSLIAGNIATASAAEALIAAGADAIKVGIGPGSICTTRVAVSYTHLFVEVSDEIAGKASKSGDIAKLCRIEK